MKRLNALVIHFANDDLREKLRVILEDKGHALCEFLELDGQANPAKQVHDKLAGKNFDVAVITLSHENRRAAATLFESEKPDTPTLICARNVESERLLEFLDLGVDDFVLAPLNAEDILLRIRRLTQRRARRATFIEKSREKLGLQKIIGKHPSFVREVEKLPKIARCDACVLIMGETGTGKEVIARATHYLSSRAEKPFVPINCGAIPHDLIENELFGHERGAFTGAMDSQRGLIQEANHGTLFLDEIDSLPLMSQVKLLRFLQDKEYRPLGSVKTQKADVGIIAASNHNLEELVQNEKLRFDLYYRLNVIQVLLPPLRERREDVSLLAMHFLDKYSSEFKKRIVSIEPDALLMLQRNMWRGNIRELENVIERAVLLCEGDTITIFDLKLADTQTGKQEESLRTAKARVVADFEKSYIQDVLKIHRGNITQAAKTAGKNRRAFFELIRKYEITVERSPP
jgi:two-component system, NtrC family, response regulator GlrR